ncbi:hypothetical protein TWF102_005279 [Orbilia oligospora]|uniref:Uncharacterized protein n=1 Tax=Orbilia oligospora TaxID=2813651 RepID=A0A7C8NE45_ORBOL|nr:hypothetical protein TWF102_005279 [Orbilia oligospora]
MAQRPKRKVDEFSGVANVITDRPVPDCLAFQFRLLRRWTAEAHAGSLPREASDLSRHLNRAKERADNIPQISIRIYMQVDVITALADGPSHSLSTS